MSRSPNGAGPPDSLSVPQAGPAGRVEIGPRFVDDFSGDNAALLDSIHALLRLHADGALSSPIPGLARQLLNNAAARLATLSAAPIAPASQRGENRSANASRRPTLHGADTEAVEAGAWRPIETAPRDGTTIDLWLSTDRRLSDVRWNKSSRCWNCDKGPAEPYAIDGFPTHWMPLPASPATPIGGLSLGVEGEQGVSVARVDMTPDGASDGPCKSEGDAS